MQRSEADLRASSIEPFTMNEIILDRLHDKVDIETHARNKASKVPPDYLDTITHPMKLILTHVETS
jgi:hypothetical protein